jgi:hypothetical protein
VRFFRDGNGGRREFFKPDRFRLTGTATAAPPLGLLAQLSGDHPSYITDVGKVYIWINWLTKQTLIYQTTKHLKTVKILDGTGRALRH